MRLPNKLLVLAALSAPLLLAGCACSQDKCCKKSCPEKKSCTQNMWPDREWLLQSLVAGVPGILEKFDPATGEFGTKPWICNDQHDMYSLAVAWGSPGKNNPYYHNEKILNVIAKAGLKLVEEQDEKGMWIFRTKNNATWGQIHMPWTFTRWIRTYYIVKDALPAEAKAKWEKGLLLGYKHIARYCQGTGTHNITTYHAAGLYVAGLAFGKEEWKTIAQKFMHRVCAKQAADGFWSEHYGPVVSYNFVYLEALGIYHHYSKDPVAKEALTRGAKFHSAMRWQDGSMVSVVDERNSYSRSRRTGNVGFTCSPEGRRYLMDQLAKSIKFRRNIDTEMAAIMLWESDCGPAAEPPRTESEYISRDGNFSVTRSAPYQWVFSAYTCKVPNNRWLMDRQTHVEIGHDQLGVIGSGGNSKMQPYFSTFTFGDPASFQPDYSTLTPNFYPKSAIRYVPDNAKINGRSIDLAYGPNQCRVTVIPRGEELTVEYRLLNNPDARAMAHFPVVLASAVRDGNGKALAPEKVSTGKSLGGKLQYNNGVVIQFPDDAEIRPRVIGFNPYNKYGNGAVAKHVISLPLSAKKPVQKLVFSRQANSLDLSQMDCIPAEAMPIKAGNAATKVLPDLDAIFLRTLKPGAEVTFTLNQPKAAVREMYVDMLHCYTYGIVQVLVNGKEAGKPFSTYNQAIVTADPQYLGKVAFKEGENTVTFRIVGKEKASGNYFTGVRGIYLK